MSWNIWLPFWINICLLFCAIPVIMELPRRLKVPLINSTPSLFKRSDTSNLEESRRLLSQNEGSSDRRFNAVQSSSGLLHEALRVVHKFVGLIRGRRNFQILLCSFLLTALASSDTKLLVQYISKRYGWTFAQVRQSMSVSEPCSLHIRPASCYQRKR